MNRSGSAALRLGWRPAPGGGDRAAPGFRPHELVWDTLPAALLAGAAVLGAAAGASGAVRLLYPAAAVLVAVALLGARRVGTYLCFCLWLFILTPGVRRWVDLQAGWLQVNPVMMAPWLVAATSLIVLLRMVMAPSFRAAGAILLVVAAASFGLVVATLQGRAIAGIFDWLRYVAPPCLGAMIILSMPQHPAIPARLLRVFALGAILTATYGVCQFAELPPWDAFWTVSSSMEAADGEPSPFEFRVFSLLNSPGSYAAFLSALLPFLFALPGPLHTLGLAAGLVGLMLTQTRSFWLATAIALGYLILRGPASLKAQAVAAVLLAGLLIPPLTIAAPEAMRRLEQRVETMTSRQIGGDTSLNDRRAQYRMLASRLDLRPQGEGLAISGSYQSYLDKQNFVVLDGQLMEVFAALGVFGGTAYFAAVLYFALCSMLLARRGCPKLVLAGSAVTLAALAILPLASPLLGESGVFFWIGMALCHVPWRPPAPASTLRRPEGQA